MNLEEQKCEACRRDSPQVTKDDNIAYISEKDGHHPQLIVDWGKTTVIWWTHKINGLHKNDFIMAAKTDTVLNATAK